MLTGKTRHRIGLRGRLVLQVEYWGAGGGSGWPIPKLQKRWRDADIHDLQDLTGSLTLWEANTKVPPMPQPPKRERPNTNPPPSYTRPPPPPPPPSLKSRFRRMP